MGKLLDYLGYGLVILVFIILGFVSPIIAMSEDPNLWNIHYADYWRLDIVMMIIGAGFLYLLGWIPLSIYLEERREEKDLETKE
jgi:hypothetical protein